LERRAVARHIVPDGLEVDWVERQGATMRSGMTALALIGAVASAIFFANAIDAAIASAADAPLTESQLVSIAIASNPQVRAVRARWMAAMHSVAQTVAPNDPIFAFTNGDSPNHPFSGNTFQTFTVTETFQFPGKALFQRDIASRTAEQAHLALAATIRDLRASVEGAYFQLLLDHAVYGINAENVANLEQVLKVTQVAYSTSKVTQTDFISAEIDLAIARQLQRQYRTAIANDETMLNQLLYRPAGSPLPIEESIQFQPLKIPLNELIDRAVRTRQEILQAALAEKNSEAAITLAKMEYLPDFSAQYIFDHYLLRSAAPSPNFTQDHGFLIGANLPVFFWMKQNEDVTRARANLEAARNDFKSIESQTAAAVTSLYRSAQLAYESGLLYRDSLTPLARQNFQVALTAYQSGKIDFLTLAGALRRSYDTRANFLQAANQFLAGQVSLEQIIGSPLPQ
jgi:outer membrane protein, heavy metal efflux system